MVKKETIAVLGAGSWGTAVAIHMATLGYPVLLWGQSSQQMIQMQQSRCNSQYLPHISFPESLTPVHDFDACTKQAQQMIIAVPSHAFASLLERFHHRPASIAWLTKGIDPHTHEFLSQLVTNKWDQDLPMAVISGPSFAKEVAQGLPTALVIAGNNMDYLKRLRQIIHSKSMRVYLSDDIIGVQVCGAVKNVLAIACGISDGLNFGANAKAALITRGLAEMARLGLSLGATADTFTGLAGVGDLVLTCTDDQSRNRRFGLELGRGTSQLDAQQHIGQVVEGKYNASQVCAIALEHSIDMPICSVVQALLQGQISAKRAVEELMNRPPREFI